MSQSQSEFWKGDILRADLEDLEKLDASDIYPRRIKEKQVLISQEDDEFLFPAVDGTANLSGRDYEFPESNSKAGTDRKEWRFQQRTSRRNRERLNRQTRWRWSPCRFLVDFPVADGSAILSGRDNEFQEPTLRRESTVRRQNLSGESHGVREEFQPEETKDDAEARKDFWSIEENFICRHHIEPRVQFFVPREGSFPISPNLHYWTKLLREEIFDLGGDWRTFKWDHVQITYGLTFG